jgi:ribosome-associated protein YbcJ (S4-like RNA binding protein)
MTGGEAKIIIENGDVFVDDCRASKEAKDFSNSVLTFVFITIFVRSAI